MPTIDISKRDLNRLVGKNFTEVELRELLAYTKVGIESVEGDLLRLEIGDINRPDLWSVEGIARVIKGILGKEVDMPNYSISSSSYLVKVDNKIAKVRPLIACAVVKSLRLNGEAIKQIIQLQEKLCESFGLRRKEAALGIYDFDKIKWPVFYTTVNPNGIKFIPLDMREALTPKEILQKHEKGRQYSHLLANVKEYPVLIDSAKEVLSMPPIINSDYTGKITQATRDVFVEVTGFNYRFILPILNTMVSALAERQGRIYSVIIQGKERIITPSMNSVKSRIDIEYCNKILGLNLKANEIIRLLRKSRYNAKIFGNEIVVEYLTYRQDIMDSRDIIEDIAIAYGYENIKPEYVSIATIGKQADFINLRERLTEILLGLNMQEVVTLTLTNKENLFKKMDLPEQEVVEIANPVSSNYSCLRSSLLSSTLELLSQNTKKEFPQRIFEIGECFDIEQNKTINKLVVAVSHKDSNFTEMRQILEYILRNLNTSYEIKEVKHESFIQGRVGSILILGKKVGIVGEIHPKVLSSWKLEMPCSVLELDLSVFKR